MWGAIRKAFIRAFVVVLLGLFVAGVTYEEPEQSNQRKSEIESMLDYYGCWEPGAHPEWRTHAVVAYRDGDPNLVGAALGVDIWHHPDENPGMELYGFCGEPPAPRVPWVIA